MFKPLICRLNQSKLYLSMFLKSSHICFNIRWSKMHFSLSHNWMAWFICSKMCCIMSLWYICIWCKSIMYIILSKSNSLCSWKLMCIELFSPEQIFRWHNSIVCANMSNRFLSRFNNLYVCKHMPINLFCFWFSGRLYRNLPEWDIRWPSIIKMCIRLPSIPSDLCWG